MDNMCNNATLGKQSDKPKSETAGVNLDRFSSHFNISNSKLSPSQKHNVQKFLYENRELFVTPESVKHKIILKPGANLRQQPVYRLSPDKREALRSQLDELLRPKINAPVDETRDLPITFPLVLVSKRTPAKDQSGNVVSKWRTTCDLRLFE